MQLFSNSDFSESFPVNLLWGRAGYTLTVSDQVTLEEFSALMKGELSGRDPMQTVRAVFSVLSRPDGKRESDSLVTLEKLLAINKEFEVRCILTT